MCKICSTEENRANGYLRSIHCCRHPDNTCKLCNKAEHGYDDTECAVHPGGECKMCNSWEHKFDDVPCVVHPDGSCKVILAGLDDWVPEEKPREVRNERPKKHVMKQLDHTHRFRRKEDDATKNRGLRHLTEHDKADRKRAEELRARG